MILKECTLFLVVVFFLASSQESFGQKHDRSRSIKIGAFCYPFEYRYNGFSLHFELENSLPRTKSLAVGPRVDFVNIKNGDPALLVGYGLKIFPFFRVNKIERQGLFISVAPVFMPKILDVFDERYGPGASGLIGYQFYLKDGLSLSAEGSWTYLRDISKYSPQFNADRTYIYLYANLKVGIRLSRRAESDE